MRHGSVRFPHWLNEIRERRQFNGVASAGSGAVGFDVLNIRRRETAIAQRREDHFGTAPFHSDDG